MKKTNQKEFERLIFLLDKFQKEYTLKEIGVFENATIMDSIRLVKKIKKRLRGK